VVAQVFVTGLRLQQLVAEAQVVILQGKTDINSLMNMRAQITESIADLGIHQQEFVEALSDAVDARCKFTRGHSKQVGTLAHAIAEALELNEKSVDLIYLAGLLGSVGKVNIPRELISKTGQLNPQELDRLRDHPNVGVSLLVKINFLSEVIPYVHYQNERWDGSGPEKLKGRSIPLGGRILAVANAYYGMTQERPYRGEPMKHEAAIATLQKEAGAKWDPLIVDTLAKISPETLS
jgi:HD-GYP domain-containing protein (c-di-GMP phosphodiesterase class II)